MVQLDDDKEEEQWYAIYGTALGEVDVQRTVNKAGLWAFTMALAGLDPPTFVWIIWALLMHWTDAEMCDL